MVDSSRTTRYYYNNNWQVLTEIDGGGTLKAWYAYGNYIDEVLMTGVLTVPMFTRYYVHDHLYSPAVLVSYTGWVFERYEYDAYGSPYILEPNFAAEADGKSDYGNPYLFTGRRVDFLDNGRLTLQYNRHRYYDYYTGRWTTQDPLGIGGASPWRRRLNPPTAGRRGTSPPNGRRTSPPNPPNDVADKQRGGQAADKSAKQTADK